MCARILWDLHDMPVTRTLQYVLHAVCTYVCTSPRLPLYPFTIVSLATNMATLKNGVYNIWKHVAYTCTCHRQMGLYLQKCIRISRQHHCVGDLVLTWKPITEQPSYVKIALRGDRNAGECNAKVSEKLGNDASSYRKKQLVQQATWEKFLIFFTCKQSG